MAVVAPEVASRREISPVWSLPDPSVTGRGRARPLFDFTLSHDSELEPDHRQYHTWWSAGLHLRYEGGDATAACPVEIASAYGAWVRPAGGDFANWLDELNDNY